MIRQLRDSEPIPDGEPKRYLSDRGYVRLRWLVGTEQYVEAYEHRVVAGRPVGMEVHHRDGDKTNNHPGNLQVLSPAEHTRLHQDQYRAEGRFTGRARDRERAARRAELEAEWERRAEMYRSGMSTVEIGRAVGRDATTVRNGLIRRGHEMRSPADGTRLALSRFPRSRQPAGSALTTDGRHHR